MNRDSRQVYTEWLVLSAQSGDERAFGELHALWTADLQRLAMVRVERAGPAEEVVQDAWVAIARGLRRLEDPARFPCWAMRIVARRCADWIRRQQSERRRREQLEGKTVPESAPNGDASDERARLRAAIARLRPDERELLHLFYDQELSVGEVAEVLGIPMGTVKSRLFHTRENLKRQIERTQS